MGRRYRGWGAAKRDARGKWTAEGEDSESRFQSNVIALAKLCGWRHYHTWNSRRSEPGFPDLCMVRGERLVFAELKRAGEKPTAEQEAWLGELRRVPGVEALLWRPEDWPAIEKTLR